jgi:hypothetical protein
MEAFSNLHDVIKSVLPDWLRHIFIVIQRQTHSTLIIESYKGFLDLRNSMGAFLISMMSAILFTDWLNQLSSQNRGRFILD